jgi:ribosomal RNA-processing protein 12
MQPLLLLLYCTFYGLLISNVKVSHQTADCVCPFVLRFNVQADEAEFDRRSRRSSAARTARASEWGHTAIFSDEAGDQDAKTMAGRSSRGGRSVAGASAVGGRGRQQQQQQQQQRGSRVQLAADSADPQDLLEPSTARQMVKLASGSAGTAAGGRGDGQPEFPRGDDGRYVIREEDDGYNKKKRKRRGDDMGFGEDDDSDMEDMRGFSGLDAAVRSVANAKSVRFAPTIAASLGNRSLGQRSSGSRPGGKAGSSSGGKQHTGDRYKPKAAGASGDVKGKGTSVDPYAYWQFDRKMLNRRRGKQAAAAKGLGGIVVGAQAGALKGAKAKRAAAAANAKRAKR